MQVIFLIAPPGIFDISFVSDELARSFSDIGIKAVPISMSKYTEKLSRGDLSNDFEENVSKDIHWPSWENGLPIPDGCIQGMLHHKIFDGIDARTCLSDKYDLLIVEGFPSTSGQAQWITKDFSVFMGSPKIFVIDLVLSKDDCIDRIGETFVRGSVEMDLILCKLGLFERTKNSIFAHLFDSSPLIRFELIKLSGVANDTEVASLIQAKLEEPIIFNLNVRSFVSSFVKR